MDAMTRADFKKELLDAGIRPSVQRLAIYEYVRRSCSHPTAETVYDALRDELGSLSLTTVYNTLKLFADAGLIMVLNIDDGSQRFDGNTKPHAHFKCNDCGEVFDLWLKDDCSVLLENAGDFRITDARLYLRGECGNCIQKRA